MCVLIIKNYKETKHTLTDGSHFGCIDSVKCHQHIHATTDVQYLWFCGFLLMNNTTRRMKGLSILK